MKTKPRYPGPLLIATSKWVRPFPLPLLCSTTNLTCPASDPVSLSPLPHLHLSMI